MLIQTYLFFVSDRLVLQSGFELATLQKISKSANFLLVYNYGFS